MLGRAQRSSLSYYRYICLGLAGNLGIVSGPQNLFQELHAINRVQSSEQSALGEKKQKADAEKTLQRLSPSLSAWVQTSPSCHPAFFLPAPAPAPERRSAGIVQPPHGEGDLFRGRRLNASIRVIAH